MVLREQYDAAKKTKSVKIEGKMKKKILLLVAVIAICGLIVTYWVNHRTIYGNDTESIIKVIESIDLYENSTINIIDMKDYGQYRIVAFLSNQNPSYIQFRKDEKGRYKYQCSETHSQESLSSFHIQLFNGDEFDVFVLHIKNLYCDVPGLSFKANEDIYEVAFKEPAEEAQWTKLKKSPDGGYQFEWFPIESDKIE